MNLGELPTFILGVAGATAGAAAIVGGKNWRFRTPVAGICVVMIVAAVVLAVTVDAASTDSNDSPAPRKPTEPPTATEATTKSVVPVSMLDRVPSSIVSTCSTHTGRDEALVDGLVESLICTTPDGPDVWYYQYVDAAAMVTAFERFHGNITGDSCADGDALGTYTIDQAPRGSWACYASSNGAVMTWTDSRHLALGVLYDDKMTPQGIHDWFFDARVVLGE